MSDQVVYIVISTHTHPTQANNARVTVLGLSVCLSPANLAVQGTGWPMTATNHFRVVRSLIFFPETTAFEKYGVKTS